MEQVALYVLVVCQWVVIGMLGWKLLKPQAVDAWDKAQETIRRLNRSDAENWQIDFDRAAGIEPQTRPNPAKHEPINVRIYEAGAFVGWLQYECSCGKYKDRDPSEWMMNANMDRHRKNIAAVERLSK